jgi:GNAT superfamily N-acetyltransferase
VGPYDASPDASAMAAVRGFLRGTVELAADEAMTIPEGMLARTPSLPEAWWLNGIWPDLELSYEELIALSDQHRGREVHEQLYLDERVGGERLSAAFRDAGWELEVELHSVLAGESDREVDTGGVIEPGLEEALALMERWIGEDETLHLSPEGVRQLVEANRRTWPLRNAKRFGVRGSDGQLVGTTVLFSDGTVAQIEDVYVVPEARGHGYARAMVSAAATLSRRERHDLTFIVADDNDWPKQLYAKLGFEPVGRSWLMHRDVR